MRSSLFAVGVVVAAAGGAAWFLLREAPASDVVPATADRATGATPQGPVLHGSNKVPTAVPRGTLAIRGKALRSNGNPAVGARITAALDQVGEVASTTVAADGTYELVRLSKALHRVEGVLVEGEAEYGTYGYVTSGVDDHDLTLTLRPRTIVFRVLTPQGDPVPRFQARLARLKGNESLGIRGEGRLELRIGMGISDESVADVAGCFLEVWNARDLEDRDLALAPGRVGPLVGTERDVEVRLRAGPTIEGRVVGPSGPVGEAIGLTFSVAKPKGQGVDFEEIFEQFLPAALQGGEPKAPPALRPPFEGISAATKTDAEGVFRVAFLGSDAVHALAVSPPKGYLQPETVNVRSGDPAVEIVLKVSVKARITVLGPDGEPRRGARVNVWARGAGGSHGNGTADASGVAELADLDPTLLYSLDVEPNGPDWMRHIPEELRKHMPAEKEPRPDPAAPSAAKHRMKDWRPADTTIRLRPAHSVSGVVLDTANRTVAGARVSLRLDDEYESETTDAEGRFRFEGLSSGKAHLEASSGLGRAAIEVATVFEGMEWAPRPGTPRELKPHEAEVQVAGDVSGVTLRVPTTLTVTLRLAVSKAEGPPKLEDLFGGLRSNFVKVLYRDGDGWSHGTTEFINRFASLGAKEQHVEVKGLVPGRRYAAWMPPVDGQYVYVEFAAEAGTVDLERKNGGSVSGRVLDLPAGTPFAHVSIEDAQGREVEDVKTDREGRFEIRGLPPSEWTVQAKHKTPGGAQLEAEGKVSTGGSVDLRLASSKEPALEAEVLLEDPKRDLGALGK